MVCGMDGSCAAGRTELYDGSWATPCDQPAVHRVASSDGGWSVLCEEHWNEIAQRWSEPYIRWGEVTDNDVERSLEDLRARAGTAPVVRLATGGPREMAHVASVLRELGVSCTVVSLTSPVDRPYWGVDVATDAIDRLRPWFGRSGDLGQVVAHQLDTTEKWRIHDRTPFHDLRGKGGFRFASLYWPVIAFTFADPWDHLCRHLDVPFLEACWRSIDASLRVRSVDASQCTWGGFHLFKNARFARGRWASDWASPLAGEGWVVSAAHVSGRRDRYDPSLDSWVDQLELELEERGARLQVAHATVHERMWVYSDADGRAVPPADALTGARLLVDLATDEEWLFDGSSNTEHADQESPWGEVLRAVAIRDRDELDRAIISVERTYTSLAAEIIRIGASAAMIDGC